MADPKNTLMIYEQVGNVPNDESDLLVGTKTIFGANNNTYSKECTLSSGNGSKKIYVIGLDQNGNEAHRSTIKTIVIQGT